MRLPKANIPTFLSRLLADIRHGTVAMPVARMILLFMILLGLGAALSAWLTAASVEKQERLERENTRLLWNIEQLKKRVADAESKLALQIEQLRQQKGEIAARERELQSLKRRLSMLESILLKRREQGVHLLAGSCRWLGPELELSLVLVKGGNYPREIDGSIEVLALRPDDMVETVTFSQGRELLPFRIRTHALVHEMIPWQKGWRPEQLVVVLRDRDRRELARMSIWVERATEPATQKGDS